MSFSDQIIIGVIGGIIVSISIGIYKKTNLLDRLFFWLKSSTILTAFSKEEINNYKNNFISNNINILNHNNLKILSTNFYDKEDHCKVLAKLILEGSIKHSFLVAPTGTGKTTFLVNLFLILKRKSRRSNTKKILLGKIHDADTKEKVERLIESGKSKKTILLLDGFDEYRENEYQSSTQFWKSLNDTWDTLREEKLKYFPLVIVAVREQFLEYDLKGDNSIVSGITSRTLGGNYINFINLLPFDNKQIDFYVRKRYSKIRNHNKVKAVVSKINSSNPEILGIPLILAFLEDISIEKLPSVGLIKYEVYQAIVEGWIQREISQSKLLEIDRNNLIEFCIYIARTAAFNTNNQSNYIIDKKIIQDFENNSFISGLENRSMLKKVKTNDSNSLMFTHNSFLEFFLVLNAEKNEENEKSTPFDKYSFARDLFIAKRWKDCKRFAPKEIEREFNDFVPSLSLINKWANFLNNFSSNQYIKELLKNDLGSWLSLEDYNWKYTFRPMNNWWVTEKEFYPLENEADRLLYPNQEIIDLVYYLKEFIHGVSMEMPQYKSNPPTYIDKIKTHYKCFIGVKKLKILRLVNFSKENHRETYLNNEILVNFKESFENIEQIVFTNSAINDSILEFFRDSTKLVSIGLKGCRVNNLTAFNNSRTTIKILHISSKCTLENGYLVSFINKLKLEYLNAEYVSFEGEIDFLENSKDTLIHLNISNTKVTSIKNLESFTKLEKLNIKNCNFINTPLVIELREKGIIIEKSSGTWFM